MRTRGGPKTCHPPGPHLRPATTDLAPGFVSHVRNELAGIVGQGAVSSAGLDVVTSLDWNLQQLAQGAMTDGVKANRWRYLTDGALVSMDPRTGQVLALVGSAGNRTPGAEYDRAVGPPRNPGSASRSSPIRPRSTATATRWSRRSRTHPSPSGCRGPHHLACELRRPLLRGLRAARVPGQLTQRSRCPRWARASRSSSTRHGGWERPGCSSTAPATRPTIRRAASGPH